MTDAGRLRAAVVGTGFIGMVHVEALRRLGVEVTGIVGSSPERVREKARTHPLPEPYESYDALLADPRVDVVHITSPNDLHHPQAKAALAAGKHVVCEKPLGLDSAQTGELLRLARASGLVHAVNFNIRFYAQCREARERVAAGALGDVRLVTGSYLQDWLMRDTDWNWRLEHERGGALRAVGDIGSHWIDLMTYITGQRVASVMADLTTFIPLRRQPVGPVETFSTGAAAVSETVARQIHTEDTAAVSSEAVMRQIHTEDTAAVSSEAVMRQIHTEDTASMLLRFAGGARGAVTVSQLSAGRKNALSFEIDGSRSALAWMGERPDELWIGHRDEPNQLLLRDPALLTAAAAAVASVPGGHAEGFENTFRELYRAVYRAVAAGGPPDEPDYPTFADGHDEALIGEAIAASAREGRWTDVDRTTNTEAWT